MNTITFDKLEFIECLQKGGFDEKQSRAAADALDRALRDSVATKADIVELRGDIQAPETRIIKWIMPLLLGQTALIVALLKFL